MMYQKTESSNVMAIRRVIGSYPQTIIIPGPILLVSGAVHGNEPSGPQAIRRVMDKLEVLKPTIKGKILGVIGNLKALIDGKRLIDRDLNRICTPEIEDDLISTRHPGFHEADEFNSLLSIVYEIEAEKDGSTIRFMDLHTTSSPSVPYISVNKRPDSLNFANQIPLPVVCGIEKFIPGHFDHYLTLRGHLGFTLEAGQHDDPKSVDHHESAIWATLVVAGMMEEKDIPDYRSHLALLIKEVSVTDAVYEVIYRHEISPEDGFVMKPGFKNFDKISRGELLAYSRGQQVLSNWNAYLFLPLYQHQGSDGFFVVKKCQ
ncbi:succinylglutamate desuccinylase/aspartoacylase family protein [Pleomorphovibrio marinus]|uniref:succinylglutamate desuccinylase/aspartoacylase family protein n=1 Tax=Pleomorphovibrio marinus TaxID=2164132 RepID=UPI000E0BFB25|nr:succinylglutamate desuccinylase/aspartoacylase family protein [Pleomorphovibrio marinus]